MFGQLVSCLFCASSQAESVVCKTWCGGSNKGQQETLGGSWKGGDWTLLSFDYHVTISVMNVKQIHFDYMHCVQQICMSQILDELMVFTKLTKVVVVTCLILLCC